MNVHELLCRFCPLFAHFLALITVSNSHHHQRLRIKTASVVSKRTTRATASRVTLNVVQIGGNFFSLLTLTNAPLSLSLSVSHYQSSFCFSQTAPSFFSISPSENSFSTEKLTHAGQKLLKLSPPFESHTLSLSVLILLS